jgi:ribosomal protein S12 methylthiotransferase
VKPSPFPASSTGFTRDAADDESRDFLRVMKKVALVSLGCAKNLVDSEVMLGVLKNAGYSLTVRPREADIIIVNTCGFIQPARDEAERALATALRLKRRDPRKKIVAAGCYVQREEESLRRRFPEVDAWTGVREFGRIADLLEGRPRPRPASAFLYSDRSPRIVSTPGSWAYVKVSEGCSHRCGFCSIPLIKGPYVSRSMASIVREVRALAEQGVREVNLVSQDTTFFGRDRGIRNGLAKLLERLIRVDGVAWVRILYGYPEEITEALLDLMKEDKVCRYLDLPFQHSEAGLLRSMKRGITGDKALDLLASLRGRLPGVAVRTSLIVGFPGEGRNEFDSLKRFVERARFDHLGVFTYSAEKGTAAHHLGDTVGPEEKERRRAEIMALQADISAAINGSYVGKILDVLLEDERRGKKRVYSGRARFQAPEVDGRILLPLDGRTFVSEGPLVRAEIRSAGAYDLRGRLIP